MPNSGALSRMRKVVQERRASPPNPPKPADDATHGVPVSDVGSETIPDGIIISCADFAKLCVRALRLAGGPVDCSYLENVVVEYLSRRYPEKWHIVDSYRMSDVSALLQSDYGVHARRKFGIVDGVRKLVVDTLELK